MSKEDPTAQNSQEQERISGYSPNAINKINALYYSSCPDAFSHNGHLANYFINWDPIQTTLGLMIQDYIKKPEVRVLELGSGLNIEKRWGKIAETITEGKTFSILLTDFSKSSIPQQQINKIAQNPRITITTGEYNFFDPMPEIPEKERPDILLTTYGFDSVWLDEDVRYTKKNGTWYKSLYKIDLADVENRESMEKALAAGYSPEGVSIFEMEKIKIDELTTPILMATETEQLIATTYADMEEIKINYPGGLIRRVREAFEQTMAEGGHFIIGDVAITTKDGKAHGTNGEVAEVLPYGTSGRAAKFKVENYYLAKKQLELEGYQVQLVTVYDMVKKYTTPDYLPESNMQVFLIVSHPRTTK